MLIVAFGILGLLICGGGFVALRYLYVTISQRQIGGLWVIGESAVAVIGIVLGCVLAVVVYPYSPTARIVGFPFMSVIWELSDGKWLDFVGPLTLPAAIGNVVTGFAIPQILFALVVRLRLK